MTSTAIVIVTVCVIYLLLIMPQMFHRKDVTQLGQTMYAHRGLHNNKGDAPENSKKAFALAVKNGYGIELDIQRTKDNVVVVHHDFTLKRSCNKEYKVCDVTYEELKEYSLFGTRERIPTLKEVLNLVKGTVPLIIEFKVDGIDLSLCNLAAEILAQYNGPYCIESFNPFVVRWYRKHHKDIIRGQLSSNFTRKKDGGGVILQFIMKNLLCNFLTRPEFIAFNHINKNRWSLLLNRYFYRIPCVGWTITSQQELESSKGRFQVYIFEQFIPK